MKKWKKPLAFLLSVCMLLQTGGMSVMAEGKAENKEEQKKEYVTTIPYTQQSGDTNFFTFAKDKWDKGDGTHTWSNAINKDKPEETYYEVKFTGHKIDVYAGKNHPMGKVKYTIDGVDKGTYSLYNKTN